MTIEEIARFAKMKGLNLLGTGDFTHPLWLKELKSKLKKENGIYEYDDVKFIPTSEISLIYTQNKRQRRIHHLILAEDFEIVEQINDVFSKKGRLDYDGRPTFGFSSVELVEFMEEIDKNIVIIPAHAWTPWYGIFGSKSGFDSVEECFEDKANKIFALETGLSSDPAMNWRLSKLDRFTLVSNSDAHSPYPWRLGREANVFELKEDFEYKDVINAIKTRENFLFTVEVDPAYGKYHYDGHRSCNVSLHPKEAMKLHNLCPKCKRELTIGVLHRVEELADREEGFKPSNAIDFKSLLPLHELISLCFSIEINSKEAWNIYNKLIEKFGNEFNVLLDAKKDELERFDKKLADVIIKNREGKIKIEPGYDGVYGKPVLDFVAKSSGLRGFV